MTSELALGPCSSGSSTRSRSCSSADAADCYLLDPSGDVLRCAAVHGLDRRSSASSSRRRGSTGLAIRASGRCASDARELDARPCRTRRTRGSRARSSAPMTWCGEVRGVLGVGTRDPRAAFERADAELLEAFAGLVSLALRNAESFEQSVRPGAGPARLLPHRVRCSPSRSRWRRPATRSPRRRPRRSAAIVRRGADPEARRARARGAARRCRTSSRRTLRDETRARPRRS